MVMIMPSAKQRKRGGKKKKEKKGITEIEDRQRLNELRQER